MEVIEKPVEKIVERVKAAAKPVVPMPADAAKIVLGSPRACRTVLESLAADAAAGRLAGGAHAPTIRAARELCRALKRARLVDD